MRCECEQLPQIFNYERYPNSLKDRLVKIDTKDGNWLELYKCRACGQHWQLDVWDKYQTNCALKIDAPETWQSFDDTPLRIQLLIESRGGFSEEKCRMADCRNKALKSLAFCQFHAYEVGLRE